MKVGFIIVLLYYKYTTNHLEAKRLQNRKKFFEKDKNYFPVHPLQKEAMLAAALVTRPPAMLLACCALIVCVDCKLTGPADASGSCTCGT